MPRYEYKVVPAPRRPARARGVKGAEARAAHALEQAMNELGVQGWEFHRAETIPFESRTALGGRRTSEQTLLVFRRVRGGTAEEAESVRRLAAAARHHESASARPDPPALRADRSAPDEPRIQAGALRPPAPGQQEDGPSGS